MSYKYTFEDIANMNPFQQLAALNLSSDEVDTMSFETMSDYMQWKSGGNN